MFVYMKEHLWKTDKWMDKGQKAWEKVSTTLGVAIFENSSEEWHFYVKKEIVLLVQMYLWTSSMYKFAFRKEGINRIQAHLKL